MATFKVERDSQILIEFEHPEVSVAERQWTAFMQTNARRWHSDPDDPPPDVGIDNVGKRWVQVGYNLFPEEDLK